jgi:hypothetical protein
VSEGQRRNGFHIFSCWGLLRSSLQCLINRLQPLQSFDGDAGQQRQSTATLGSKLAKARKASLSGHKNVVHEDNFSISVVSWWTTPPHARKSTFLELYIKVKYEKSSSKINKTTAIIMMIVVPFMLNFMWWCGFEGNSFGDWIGRGYCKCLEIGDIKSKSFTILRDINC